MFLTGLPWKKVLIMNIVSAVQDLGWQVHASFTGIPEFAWCSANIILISCSHDVVIWSQWCKCSREILRTLWVQGAKTSAVKSGMFLQFSNPVSESQLAAKPLLASENSWCDRKVQLELEGAGPLTGLWRTDLIYFVYAVCSNWTVDSAHKLFSIMCCFSTQCRTITETLMEIMVFFKHNSPFLAMFCNVWD